MDDTTTNPEACPGCSCMPGDGLTPGCYHPDGCGYHQRPADAQSFLTLAVGEAQALVADRIAAAIASAEQRAEQRGYERGRAEAHDARNAALVKLGGEPLHVLLERVIEHVEEANREADHAFDTLTTEENTLDQEPGEAVQLEVDASAARTVEIPSADDSFDEVRAFIAGNGGDTLLASSDELGEAVRVVSVSVELPTQTVEDARDAADAALQVLRPLLAEVRRTYDAEETERAFEEAGRLTDSAVAEAEAQEDESWRPRGPTTPHDD
jgi:hypothetical protein